MSVIGDLFSWFLEWAEELSGEEIKDAVRPKVSGRAKRLAGIYSKKLAVETLWPRWVVILASFAEPRSLLF